MATWQATSGALRLSGLALRQSPSQIHTYTADLNQFIPDDGKVEFARRIAPWANCAHYRASSNGKVPYSSPNPAVNELLQRPNRETSRYSFFYQIVDSILHYGTAFIYIDRGVMGDEPRALWCFAPNELKMKVEHGRIYYEVVRWSNEIIEDEDICRISERPTVDLHISPGLERAWPLLLAYAEGIDRVLAVFRNGMTATTFITTPGVLSDASKSSAQKYFDATKGNKGTSRGGMVMLDNSAEIKKLDVGGETAYAPFLDSIVAQISSALGCPQWIASGKTDVKYSNAREMQLLVHNDVIAPMAKQIALELGDSLGAPVIADTEELLLGDLNTRLTLLQGAKEMMTTNERRELGNKWKLWDLPELDGEKYDEIPLPVVMEELRAVQNAERLDNSVAELIAEEEMKDPDNVVSLR